MGSSAVRQVAAGFVAGFLATLVFHQLTSLTLAVLGLSPNWPYAMRPVPPWGVPQFLSLAFWGGVWGILYPFQLPRLPRQLPQWGWAVLVGALGPTLVSWFIVAPLKGLPMMQGGNLMAMARGLLVNGMWGIGTLAFLHLFARLPGAAIRSGSPQQQS